MQYSSHRDTTSHLTLSWFNILISPVWCHKSRWVCVCVCVCLFQTVMERTDERLWSWRMKKRPNTKKTIWLWSLMDAIGAFYSLSAFLFLSLSSFLPSLRLFLQSLWRHQSEWKSACTHVHLRWFQTWFICSKQQLALMCGGLVTMSFFLTQSGDWYWWWPPCCFHSSLK